jgi:hypothetical protein
MIGLFVFFIYQIKSKKQREVSEAVIKLYENQL